MGTYNFKERRSVKINEELYQIIKNMANAQNIWIGSLIDRAIEQYIKRRKWNKQ